MCDLDQQRLKHLHQLYPEVQASTDYDSVLADPEVNAVAIATAVRFHFPMAKASLLAGKHTFIEKPMAASVAECEELINIAQRHGLVLMVGHTFLYSPAVRKIKEIVRSGDIGEIRYISARRLNTRKGASICSNRLLWALMRTAPQPCRSCRFGKPPRQ